MWSGPKTDPPSDTSESVPMPRRSLRTRQPILLPCCLCCRVNGGPAACVAQRKSNGLLVPCAPRNRTASSHSQLTLPSMFPPVTRGKKLAKKYPFSFEACDHASALSSISELRRLQKQGGLIITSLSVAGFYPTPLSGRFGTNSREPE